MFVLFLAQFDFAGQAFGYGIAYSFKFIKDGKKTGLLWERWKGQFQLFKSAKIDVALRAAFFFSFFF
jgi:hypothetical protein